MFGWGEAQDSAQQVYGAEGGWDHPDHKGKFSHELIAGAAAFEGFKAYEDHQRKEGKVVNHAFAKELIAGFVGGEVDKLAETHGMNEYDKFKAHERAKDGAREMYEEHYERNQGADQYDPNQYDRPDRFNNPGY